MKEKTVTLDEAFRISLPKMIKNKKALDLIVEILENSFYSNKLDCDSKIVKTLKANGDFGRFDIYIHELYGIFWITAPEFDDDGYFTTKEDAIEFAEDRFEPFL